MKKQNIIKSLLSLILSVSMVLTGLGLTVHATVVEAISDPLETEVSLEDPGPDASEPEYEQPDGVEDPAPGELEEETDDLVAEPDTFAGLKNSGDDFGLFAVIEQNLVTEFELTIVKKDNTTINIIDDHTYELDVDDLNAVQINYSLDKPNDLVIAENDTYTINLPDFFDKNYDTSATPKNLLVEEKIIGTLIIKAGQAIITFNEDANGFDDQEFFIEIQGAFDTNVFVGVEEVEIDAHGLP